MTTSATSPGDKVAANLVFVLASQIVNAQKSEALKLGVLGGGGSGRSALIHSLCAEVVRDEPESWIVASFRASAQCAETCVVASLFQSILAARHVGHGFAKVGSLSIGGQAGPGFGSRLASLLRFSLLTRKGEWLCLLLSASLFLALYIGGKPGVTSELSFSQVSMPEATVFFGLIILAVLIVKQIRQLLVIRASGLTPADVCALYWVRSNPLFGRAARMILVADDFHAADSANLPSILNTLNAMPDSLTVIYGLDPDITLAAFAAGFSALNSGHHYVDVQQQARAQLARLLDLSVNLDAVEVAPADDRGHLQLKPQPETCAVDAIPLRFNKWVGYFGFKNPRKLNRLLCTYYVLRHLYGEDGALSKGDNPVLDNLTADISCPMLIALCTMEYINSQSDPVLRMELLRWIERYRQRTFNDEAGGSLSENDPVGKLTEEIIAVVTRQLKPAQKNGADYASLVAAYVLPALKMHKYRAEPAADRHTNKTEKP